MQPWVTVPLTPLFCCGGDEKGCPADKQHTSIAKLNYLHYGTQFVPVIDSGTGIIVC
jgi:hypothetical protein